MVGINAKERQGRRGEKGKGIEAQKQRGSSLQKTPHFHVAPYAFCKSNRENKLAILKCSQDIILQAEKGISCEMESVEPFAPTAYRDKRSKRLDGSSQAMVILA